MRKFALVLALALASAAAYAQTVYSPEAPAALPFAAVQRSPVGVALGGASAVSVSDWAYSAFENPALPAFGEGKVAGAASWQLWAPSSARTNCINAAAAVRLSGKFSLSMGFSHGTGDEYDIVGSSGNVKDSFAPKETVDALGAGFAVSEKLAFGAGAVLVSEKLSGEDSYSAAAFNVSATYRSGALCVAAGLNSVGGSVKSASGDRYSLPGAVYVSGSYGAVSFGPCALSTAGDFRYYFTSGVAGGLGLSAEFFSLASLRAGYHFASAGAPVPSYASAGLGVHLFGVSLNLAYLFASEALSGSLLAGVAVEF